MNRDVRIVYNGMFKNEAGIITRMLESIYKHIDYYVIQDNGSTDGTFVYLGFRPKYILIKRTNTTEDWIVVDSSRSPYNVTNLYLLPSSSSAEGSTTLYDFVSNGIKFRSNSKYLF